MLRPLCPTPANLLDEHHYLPKPSPTELTEHDGPWVENNGLDVEDEKRHPHLVDGVT